LQNRFFIHRSIREFCNAVLKAYGKPEQSGLLFPSFLVAQRFELYLLRTCPQLARDSLGVVELDSSFNSSLVSARVWACFFPSHVAQIAKQFWQHTGDGVSSRRAEYCYSLFKAGLLCRKSIVDSGHSRCKGPRRYQKIGPKHNGQSDQMDINSPPTIELDGHSSYVEERYGRNLSISLASNAKIAIKRRIAGLLTADVELDDFFKANQETAQSRNRGFSEDDVYLYPTGMSAIFNTHQYLLAAKETMKSVCYGWVSFRTCCRLSNKT
jgi:cystathionine gamma-synthase